MCRVTIFRAIKSAPYIVLRKKRNRLSKRHQGGGGVMFWAPFGWNYKGDIEFIDGRIDAVKYVDMLKIKLNK
jgi:hypothetical protein